MGTWVWAKKFIFTVFCDQFCHQAAGGCGFLRGWRHQQRSAGPGRRDDQSQPRETETDEGTEHPQTGMIQNITQRFSRKRSVRRSWTDGRLVRDVVFRSLASWRLHSRTAVEEKVHCCVWRSWRTRRILPTSTCSDCATESSDTPRRTTARTRWAGRWWWRWWRIQPTEHWSVVLHRIRGWTSGFYTRTTSLILLIYLNTIFNNLRNNLKQGPISPVNAAQTRSHIRKTSTTKPKTQTRTKNTSDKEEKVR